MAMLLRWYYVSFARPMKTHCSKSLKCLKEPKGLRIPNTPPRPLGITAPRAEGNRPVQSMVPKKSLPTSSTPNCDCTVHALVTYKRLSVNTEGVTIARAARKGT